MKKQFIVSVFFLIFKTTIIFGQVCDNKFDSVSVVKLIKNKGFLLKQKGITELELATIPSYQPVVSFEKEKCQWIIVSTTYTTTKKGKCRKTNGCTVITTQTVIVSATTKKIIRSTKKKKIFTKL